METGGNTELNGGGMRHSNKFAGGGDAKAAVGLDDFVVLDPYY